MRRREVIAGIGVAGIAWPLGLRAQPTPRTRLADRPVEVARRFDGGLLQGEAERLRSRIEGRSRLSMRRRISEKQNRAVRLHGLGEQFEAAERPRASPFAFPTSLRSRSTSVRWGSNKAKSLFRRASRQTISA